MGIWAGVVLRRRAGKWLTPFMPLFSVVIATRNRPDTLARALSAVQCQTFGDFEVVVVDDGSDERHRPAMDGLRRDFDARFRFVGTGPAGHPGSGPAAARNAGIALAQGRFLAFCDDDDEWCDPGHLAASAEALARLPEIDLLFANQTGISDGAPVVADWFPDLTGRLDRLPCEGADFYRVDRGLLAGGRGFGHLNVTIARATLVRDVGGFWNALPYEEDLDLYWRLLDRARGILFRNKVAARHNVPRAGGANASSRFGPADKWLMRSLVARRTAGFARTPEVRAAAAAAEGDALRHLAFALVREGRPAAASLAARQALAARFSPGWAAYALWLSLGRG